MPLTFRIISIGALAVHELWQRQGAARTAHATTTLIESDGRRILVDPSLPGQVLTARLAERAGITPDEISDVFLTSFRPEGRRGMDAFPEAKWYLAEAEREAVGAALLQHFEQTEDEALRETLRGEIALLKRIKAAPDKLAANVDLFPSAGFTPGCCGLLLSHPSTTTVIAGPAVATVEHLEQGRVLRGAVDIEQAQQSLLEVVEIADMIVPGYDNLVPNPSRRGM